MSARTTEAEAIKHFGTRDPRRRGEEREPLLAALETDRASVRAQFRRLGVTHAVVMPPLCFEAYEVLLSRLIRELADEGRARPVTELSTDLVQLWEIDP